MSLTMWKHGVLRGISDAIYMYVHRCRLLHGCIKFTEYIHIHVYDKEWLMNIIISNQALIVYKNLKWVFHECTQLLCMYIVHKCLCICHICIQIITSQAKQQQFSICTFSESYAARAADSAGHKQERFREFNSLMQQYSSDASELGIVLSNRSTVWSV